jgi:P-type E1-E2 ATPase
MNSSIKNLFLFFKLPFIILIGIGVYSVLLYGFKLNQVATIIALIIIALGSFDTIKETIISLRHKQFALDYIAILAITVGLVSGQYLVAMVIVLMLSGGQTLEKYGTAKARESLTALTERIPNEVILWNQGKAGESLPIEQVKPGEEIMVRKGEVVPLDGVLVSGDAVMDESSLTGEPFAVEKTMGNAVRSGTVNMGNIIVVKVTATDKDSTYRKIIELVRQAQIEKAPLIRLADRYSVWFTIVTLVLAVAGYLLDHSLNRVLAVLVVATPCPLILATPIALFGGMNTAAKHRILTKKISSLETLSRVSAIVFDKTGTLTAGRPIVSQVEVLDSAFDLPQIYSIAEAIERNSLHPLAKAIVASAKEAGVPRIVAEKINEKIGSGISAIIGGAEYSLQKLKDTHHRNAVELLRNDAVIARFEFEDRLKDDSVESVSVLKK